jgi:hypothetical protein
MLHQALHLRPIGHGGVDIGQRRGQRGGQFAPRLGIGALGFEVDDRFAQLADRLARRQIDQRTQRIAPHRHHRVEQALDRQALGGDRGGDGIDQERHVVVDHGDAQRALPAHRLDRHGRIRPLAQRGGGQREARRLDQPLPGKVRLVAGQQRPGQARGQGRNEVLGIRPARFGRNWGVGINRGRHGVRFLHSRAGRLVMPAVSLSLVGW